MVIIPKRNWTIVKLDGEPAIHVICPGCGVNGLLNHVVHANGKVHPSLECPDDLCNFHDHVILDGFGG